MWRELMFQNNVIKQGVRRSLASGLVKINADTGLIDLAPNAHSMSYDANWLFFGHNTASRDCFTWHSVMFNCFDGFVPEYCRLRCYKVVVKVRNFYEAMKFREVMIGAPYLEAQLVPIQGKVGKDERAYSRGAFNGYIYADGLEDALGKYKLVRRLVDKGIEDGHHIDIIIKRTCTEFELQHGPTDAPYWQQFSEEERVFQSHLEDIYAGLKHSSVQPDWLQNKIISDMVEWANMINDDSWLKYFDCEDYLTMKAVTYHHLAKEDNKEKDKKVYAIENAQEVKHQLKQTSAKGE